MNRWKLILIMAICCVAASLTASAQTSNTNTSNASTSNTDTDVTLDEVVVTAEEVKVELLNMDVPLKNLPMTVTRLDGETLERKNITELDEAVRFLPGVTVYDQLGAFQRFSVRGSNDAVISIDGIRDERSLVNNVPFGDLSSVESIEVVKGPMSILSGHSVIGGTINIVRKKPTDKTIASAKISYGSWNEKRSTIDFGGKFVGPVTYRANVYYATGDGYRDVFRERLSGTLSFNSDIKKTGGNLDVKFSFNNDHYGTEIGGAPLMPGDMYSSADDSLYAKSGAFNPMANYHDTYNDLANNNMHRKNFDFSAQYTRKLTDWANLRYKFSHGHSDLDYAAVENLSYRTSTNPIYDWYYTNSRGVKTYVELDSLRSGNPLTFNPDSYTYTSTIDLTGKFNVASIANTYTAGWSYSFFDYTQYNGYASGDVWGPGLNQQVSVVNPQKVRNWWNSRVSAVTLTDRIDNGIYAYDTFDINEQWKGMIGGRLDFHEYKTATASVKDNRQEWYDRVEGRRSETFAASYRAGVVYIPVTPLAIYFSMSSSFRPNTTAFNANTIYLDKNGNQFNPDANGGMVYRPETGNQFETGVRYELHRMLEVNASVFYTRRHNLVRRLGSVDVEEEDGSIVNKTVQGQLGRQTYKGFDMDFTFTPLSTLKLVGGWGRTESITIKSSVNLDEWPGFTEPVAINTRATGVPRTTAYAYADYTVPRKMLRNLSFHLSATFTDRNYRNIANNTYYPSRVLVDGGAYYTFSKQMSLSVTVENIFNKEYFTRQTTYGKPRNFMTSIAYSFK